LVAFSRLASELLAYTGERAIRMKSTDVYREAREVLAPWFKQQGFTRTKGGMLGWHKTIGERHLFLWFQVSQHGWDPYAGSKFVVEFQFSNSARMFESSRDGVRDRLPRFLTGEELAEVRMIQNEIIRALPKPPPSYFILQMDERIVSWYANEFEEVDVAYEQNDDIWFRYHEPVHVRRWAELVLRVAPRLVQDLVAGHRPTSDTWTPPVE
jgi:hypothetical protein